MTLSMLFFTCILKIDEQRFLYIDPCIPIFLELVRDNQKLGQDTLKHVWDGVNIYQICRPAACSFIKSLTLLYRFNGFHLLCRSARTPWNVCTRFVLVFFSSTILQYKKLKISQIATLLKKNFFAAVF